MKVAWSPSMIEELHVLLVEPDALDRLLGAEALVELGAAAQVAHLDLGEGAALAGLHQLALQHEPQLALMLEHIARLDVDGVDLHGDRSRERDCGSGLAGFLPAWRRESGSAVTRRSDARNGGGPTGFARAARQPRARAAASSPRCAVSSPREALSRSTRRRCR